MTHRPDWILTFPVTDGDAPEYAVGVQVGPDGFLTLLSLQDWSEAPDRDHGWTRVCSMSPLLARFLGALARDPWTVVTPRVPGVHVVRCLYP